MTLSEPAVFYMFPVTILTKVTYKNIEISICFLKVAYRIEFRIAFLKIKFSLTWDPMRIEFQNATPAVLIRFRPNVFSEFSPWQPSQRLLLVILKFQI